MRLALYFGYGDGGHWMRSRERIFNGSRKTLAPDEDLPGFPWTGSLLDSGLLKNGLVDEPPDGRVFWTCGGRPDLWHAFVWWDRSGDKRSASNSGFYVRGWPFTSRENLDAERRGAFAYACEQWPDVVGRQRFPLVLQEMRP